jgi:hypothetical protein
VRHRPYVPSRQEATHPRCGCEGYPDRPGRASSKEGESWPILSKLSWLLIASNTDCGGGRPAAASTLDNGHQSKNGTPISARGQNRGFFLSAVMSGIPNTGRQSTCVPQCLAIGRRLRSRHTARSAPPGSDVDSLHSTVGQPAGLVVSARTRLSAEGTRKRTRTAAHRAERQRSQASGRPRSRGATAAYWARGHRRRRIPAARRRQPARAGGAVRAANAYAARIRTTRSGTANCRAISAELMFRNIRLRWIVTSAAPDHHEIGGRRRNSEAVHQLPPDKQRRPWLCRPNLTG